MLGEACHNFRIRMAKTSKETLSFESFIAADLAIKETQEQNSVATEWIMRRFQEKRNCDRLKTLE